MLPLNGSLHFQWGVGLFHFALEQEKRVEEFIVTEVILLWD